MKYYVAALLACLSCVVFGCDCQGQVLEDVASDLYDIGLVVQEPEEVVPDDKGNVLVVFGAPWCTPCNMMVPQWATLKAQGYTVVKINVDDMEADEKYKTAVDAANKKRVDDGKHRGVPDIYVVNTNTKKVVAEWHKYTRLTKIKPKLWKPESAKAIVPEPFRSRQE